MLIFVNLVEFMYTIRAYRKMVAFIKSASSAFYRVRSNEIAAYTQCNRRLEDVAKRDIPGV